LVELLSRSVLALRHGVTPPPKTHADQDFPAGASTPCTRRLTSLKHDEYSIDAERFDAEHKTLHAGSDALQIER
jgi:hypothetical protein